MLRINKIKMIIYIAIMKMKREKKMIMKKKCKLINNKIRMTLTSIKTTSKRINKMYRCRINKLRIKEVFRMCLLINLRRIQIIRKVIIILLINKKSNKTKNYRQLKVKPYSYLKCLIIIPNKLIRFCLT